MENPINRGNNSLVQLFGCFLVQNPLLKEFLRDQVPMIAGVFCLGLLTA